MSELFQKGLYSLINHLQQLKAEGQTHVEVQRESLTALRKPASKPPAPPSSRQTPPAPKVLDPSTHSTEPTPQAENLSPEEKQKRFDLLQARAMACEICPHLARSRTQVVFGTGNIDAAVMFIGEAPGADEDTQGEPFVGRAGQLLTKMIEAMGLSRSDVYIGNILKCRPDMPTGSSGNRPPTADEIAHCRPYIISQIDLIRPKALVALGSSSIRGLLNVDTPIGRLRGKWVEFRGIPLMPTFHPSYLLRKAGPSGITEKRKAWEDLLMVMDKLQMPISEKQQNYFLKAL